MKKMCLLLLWTLFIVDCQRHPPEYLTEATFEFGTNALVTLNHEFPNRGYYEVSFEFLRGDYDAFKKGGWSSTLNVSMHLLLKGNGKILLETNISELKFSNVNDVRKSIVYFAPGMGVSVTNENTLVECALEDHTVEFRHSARLLLFKVVAK